MRSASAPETGVLRLLDHIAQSSHPLLIRQSDDEIWRLPGAAEFSAELSRCPLRYVLSDELVRLCVELGFSEGDELAGCLDLLHFPAETLWVEWDDRARRAALGELLPECCGSADPEVVRGGALVRADARGRAAALRTFWLRGGEPMLAAVETRLDLDGSQAPAAPPAALLDGEAIAVHDPRNRQLDRLLQRARFRLDPRWQHYYQRVAQSAEARSAVLRGSVATVVFDVPLLLALCLLLTLRVGLPQVRVSPLRLNAKRARLGRPPLLEHVEVSCPVFAAPLAWPGGAGEATRGAPRFHHVRGHIVRRDNIIFWRRAHWRGHLRLGAVRSRTVELHASERASRAETA